MAEKEVKVKLVLDTDASSLLSRIKDGFRDTARASDDAKSSVADFGKQMFATFAAVNLKPAIDQIFRFGEGFAQAAAHEQDATQAIAGLIAGVQGIPWDAAADKSGELGDRIEDIAVGTQQLVSDTEDAFQVMTELMGASDAGIARSIEGVNELGTVANVLGKQTSDLAREYGFMSEGVLKVKGQLFQILQPTGIFGKDTKKAAEYWSKLTEESRIQLLAQGLGQVSERLAKATPTAHDLVNEMTDLWDIAKRRIGEPFLEAVMPELSSLVKELEGGREGVEQFAKTMAKDVGRWVREAADEVRAGIAYLREHHEEIRNAIVSAFDHARAVVAWILAHKAEIAVAFGARAAAPLVGKAVEGGKALIGAAQAGVPALGIAGTGGGALAGAATIGAFAAAVAGFALAVDQWQKLMAETGGGKSEAEQDQAARKAFFEKMIAAPEVGPETAQSIKAFEEVRRAYVETATELGENSRAAGELADKAWAAHRAIRQQVEPVEKVAAVFAELEKTGGTAGLDVSKPVAMIDQAFNAAIQSSNAGAQQYIADILVKSKSLQGAFLAASGLTAEGFDTLAGLVGDKAKDFAEQLKNVSGLVSAKEAAKPAAPQINFSGGQTFNIKQDFRDQDPDRVAIVFRRDLQTQATRRYQASTGLPFGT